MSDSDVDYVSLAEPLVRLGRDVKQAAATMCVEDARWLVDEYYTIQDARIRSAHQLRTHAEGGEPHRLIDWVNDTMRHFEAALRGALGHFAGSYRVGQWMQAQTGIGPVLSAGLLVGFDVRKAPTVGHFWRFAGLDPTLRWPGPQAARKKLTDLAVDSDLSADQVAALAGWSGQHPTRIWNVWNNGFRDRKKVVKGKAGLIRLFSVRPWNQRLKAICLGRLGESFNKHKGRDTCFYGHLLAQKQEELWAANLAGEFSEQATRDLAEVGYGKTTEAYAWKSGRYCPDDVKKAIAEYGTITKAKLTLAARQVMSGELDDKPLIPGSGAGIPMLPPQQIYFRARRWTVKLFISHLHEVMYRDFHKGQAPPVPFVFHDGDHRHRYDVPLWPGEYNGKSLRELLAAPGE